MGDIGMRYTPFVLPLLAAVVFGCALGVYSLRFKHVPAARAFRWMVFNAAAWAALYALDISSTSLSGKVIWASLRFPFIAQVTVAVLIMAARYSGRESWINPKSLAVLSVVPAITSVLSLTSTGHGLFLYNYRVDEAGLFPVLLFDRGPWYWVHLLYGYGCIFGGVFLLARSLRDTQPLYRRPVTILIIAVLIGVVSDGLFTAGVTLQKGYNLTPSLFVIADALIALALFRYRLLDLVPIGRSVVVDSMEDVVVISDTLGRVVDLNHAALKASGLHPSQAIGQFAGVVLRRWGGQPDRYAGVSNANEEVTLKDASGDRTYDLTITPIADLRGRLLGQLTILRDITERKRAQELLLNQSRTRAVLEERERLAREVAETLHGRVQTRLLVASLQMDQCEHLMDSQLAKAKTLLGQARAIIDEIREREIRQASHRLHPSIINVGLVPAVRSLCAGFEEHVRIALDVDPGLARVDGVLENCIPGSLRLAVYRVLEEALNNVCRHAGAGRVNMTLGLEAERLLIVAVQDDGCGFDTKGVKGGLGLSIIAGRVAQAGGTWRIDSTVGGGTRLSASFPLGLARVETPSHASA